MFSNYTVIHILLTVTFLRCCDLVSKNWIRLYRLLVIMVFYYLAPNKGCLNDNMKILVTEMTTPFSVVMTTVAILDFAQLIFLQLFVSYFLHFCPKYVSKDWRWDLPYNFTKVFWKITLITMETKFLNVQTTKMGKYWQKFMRNLTPCLS